MTVAEKINFLRQRLMDMGYVHPLESDLQACEFLAEYELGMEVYSTLSDPTASDERWAGLCYMACGQRERAAELFMRSIERGYVYARIDLCRLFIVIGRYEDASKEIESLNPDEIKDYNKALWYRNYSFLYHNYGDGKNSLHYMNMAWRSIQNCPEFKFIAPKILNGLVNLYVNKGDNKKALYYTERAQEIAVGEFVWSLVFSKMFIFMNMGRISDGESIADSLINESEIDLYIVIAYIVKGQIALISKNIEKACVYFETAVEKSRETMLSDLELISSGYLVMSYNHLLDGFRSQMYLERMRKLKSSPSNDSLYTLRKISILKDPDHYSDRIENFFKILEFREQQKDVTEVVRVLIHLINHMLIFDDARTSTYEQRLMEIFIKHNNIYDSIEEWVFADTAYQYIQYKYNKIIPCSERTILFNTIGQEYVKIDDKLIKLPLKRTLELMVYLIYHQHSSLNSILTDVFYDIEKTKSKNYFHQIRHMLNQQELPFFIEYDKSSRRYHLKTDFNIVWDLREVIEGKKKLEGIFLPSSGSDWVIELNQRLSE